MGKKSPVVVGRGEVELVSNVCELDAPDAPEAGLDLLGALYNHKQSVEHTPRNHTSNGRLLVDRTVVKMLSAMLKIVDLMM